MHEPESPREPQDQASYEHGWRIDELARRSGVAVDTIRFYQRGGLLPLAQRAGRSLFYGPAHLRQLEAIRDLQARHFNLAAVKALLNEGRLRAVQALFSSEDATLSREELIERARVDPGLVRMVEESGLLVSPAESGRTGYDAADVELLESVASLIRLGMPAPVVGFLTGMYSEHFAAMQARVTALFRGDAGVDWPEGERLAFLAGLGGHLAKVFAETGRILNYAHHATVRRMTVTPGSHEAPESRDDDR